MRRWRRGGGGMFSFCREGGGGIWGRKGLRERGGDRDRDGDRDLMRREWREFVGVCDDNLPIESLLSEKP